MSVRGYGVEGKAATRRRDETRRDAVVWQRTPSEPRQKEAKMERRESGGGSRAKENVDEKTFV